MGKSYRNNQPRTRCYFLLNLLNISLFFRQMTRIQFTSGFFFNFYSKKKVFYFSSLPICDILQHLWKGVENDQVFAYVQINPIFLYKTLVAIFVFPGRTSHCWRVPYRHPEELHWKEVWWFPPGFQGIH